jgi:putative hydrolase of the HAD superfamily
MIQSKSGRCVVLDLDDTLYDEIDFVRSGYTAVAGAVRKHFGVDCREWLNQRLESGQLADAFQAMVEQYGLGPDAIGLMMDTYRFHLPTIQPRDGVVGVLTELKRRDGVLGCITDGRGATQRNKLAALGLRQFFDVVLISEETGHGKPDPFNFLEMMRQVSSGEFWYIADNPAKDFVAPNSLGWRTVGIRSDRNVHAPPCGSLPREYYPETECSMCDLLAVLTSRTSDRGWLTG